jgi:hypothetical protein
VIDRQREVLVAVDLWLQADPGQVLTLPDLLPADSDAYLRVLTRRRLSRLTRNGYLPTEPCHRGAGEGLRITNLTRRGRNALD